MRSVRRTGWSGAGDGIVRSVEVLDGVAFLTTILVGRSGKLPVVGVLVAIRTRLEFDLIDRVLPCGEVALGALHLDVLALERILDLEVGVSLVAGLHADTRPSTGALAAR